MDLERVEEIHCPMHCKVVRFLAVGGDVGDREGFPLIGARSWSPRPGKGVGGEVVQ
jgi:hypothetical protein